MIGKALAWLTALVGVTTLIFVFMNCARASDRHGSATHTHERNRNETGYDFFGNNWLRFNRLRHHRPIWTGRTSHEASYGTDILSPVPWEWTPGQHLQPTESVAARKLNLETKEVHRHRLSPEKRHRLKRGTTDIVNANTPLAPAVSAAGAPDYGKLRYDVIKQCWDDVDAFIMWKEGISR